MITFHWFEVTCQLCGVTAFQLLDQHEDAVECSHCGKLVDRALLVRNSLLLAVNSQVAKRLDKENV